MPYTITFDKLPLGRAMTGAKAEGELVSVRYIEFTSTEDGQAFVEQLEGFPDDVLRMLADQCDVTVIPSQVDHMLAIVHKDGTATVYLNELAHLLNVRVNRPVRKGESVLKSDVVDVGPIRLGDVEVPPNAGVILLFSVGWRKGLFYDFGPLNPHVDVRRPYDWRALFGKLYARVMFQERFSIQDPEWHVLFQASLFPFAALRYQTIDKMLAYIRSGWDLSGLSDVIIDEVEERLPDLLQSWGRHPAFKPHIQFLERAVERHQSADYLSSTSLAFHRIEGILRSHHINIGSKNAPKQSALADSAVASADKSRMCLLLPDKFKDYLNRVYFRNFSPNSIPCADEIMASRHSIAHGVAGPDEFSAMTSSVSFLILHQLFYCLESTFSGEAGQSG